MRGKWRHAAPCFYECQGKCRDAPQCPENARENAGRMVWEMGVGMGVGAGVCVGMGADSDRAKQKKEKLAKKNKEYMTKEKRNETSSYQCDS